MESVGQFARHRQRKTVGGGIGENIGKFAEMVRRENARDRYLLRLYTVMLFVCFYQTVWREDGGQEVLYAGNKMWILFIILMVAWTKQFYRRYLVIVPKKKKLFEDTVPVYVSDFMGCHPIPLEQYFRYIRKKIRIWRGVLFGILLFYSLFFTKEIFQVWIAVLGMVASSFTGWLYQKYYEKKVVSRKQSLGLQILEGIFDVFTQWICFCLGIVAVFLLLGGFGSILEKVGL